MKAGFRKFAAALLAGTLALSACGPAPAPAPKEEAAVEEAAPAAEAEATAEEATTEAESDEYFKSWADDSKVVEQVKAYVEDVTNPDSENFIPVEDRIVTADFDGTLYGELDPIYFDWAIVIHRLLWDSTYTPTDDQVELAHIIEAIEQTRVFPDGLDVRHASTLVKSFEGMTVEEETEYAKEFAETPAKKFKNLVRKDAYYVPMRELVDYLEANDFKFYVVSGTDRVLLRSLVPFGFPELPASQIIGSPMQINASGQGEKDGLEYMWVPGDETVNVGELWYKNLKMNKQVQGPLPLRALRRHRARLGRARQGRVRRQAGRGERLDHRVREGRLEDHLRRGRRDRQGLGLDLRDRWPERPRGRLRRRRGRDARPGRIGFCDNDFSGVAGTGGVPKRCPSPFLPRSNTWSPHH